MIAPGRLTVKRESRDTTKSRSRPASPLRSGPALAVLAVLCLAAAPPEPDGFHSGVYRAPVPATLAGRPALTTAEAAAFWRDHTAIFIDTLARPPRPDALPPGTLWHPKPRLDIPGSLWMADTGYDVLPPETAAFFARSLQAATGGDLDQRLVFYCLANCWMSWNAAKRAQQLGYRRVEWYAEGTDGWEAAGLPLEAR